MAWFLHTGVILCMAVYYVYTATMVPLCIYSYYGSWILASYILYLVTNSGCIYYCFFLFLYRSHGLWVVWDWHIFFCCSVQQTEKKTEKKSTEKKMCHSVVVQETRLVGCVGLVPSFFFFFFILLLHRSHGL